MKLITVGKGFRTIDKAVIHQYRTVYLTQVSATLTDDENAVMKLILDEVQIRKQEGIVIFPDTICDELKTTPPKAYKILKSLRDKHLIFLYLHHWTRGMDREHCAWLNLAYSGSHYHKPVQPNKWQRYFEKHKIIRYKTNKEAIRHLEFAYFDDEDEKVDHTIIENSIEIEPVLSDKQKGGRALRTRNVIKTVQQETPKKKAVRKTLSLR